MRRNQGLAELRRYFWDSDVEALDIRRHRKYIIDRILEMGDEQSVTWMKKMFSAQDIRERVRDSRQLSEHSRHFWQLVFGL